MYLNKDVVLIGWIMVLLSTVTIRNEALSSKIYSTISGLAQGFLDNFADYFWEYLNSGSVLTEHTLLLSIFKDQSVNDTVAHLGLAMWRTFLTPKKVPKTH